MKRRTLLRLLDSFAIAFCWVLPSTLLFSAITYEAWINWWI